MALCFRLVLPFFYVVPCLALPFPSVSVDLPLREYLWKFGAWCFRKCVSAFWIYRNSLIHVKRSVWLAGGGWGPRSRVLNDGTNKDTIEFYPRIPSSCTYVPRNERPNFLKSSAFAVMSYSSSYPRFFAAECTPWIPFMLSRDPSPKCAPTQVRPRRPRGQNA